MNYRSISDPAHWNTALLALPGSHTLQSWEWGQVKGRHNWTPTRLLWEQDGHPVAAAQVLYRRLPHTPWGIMYVPKGPVLNYADSTSFTQVLRDLEFIAKRQGAILAKVDPDTNLAANVETLNARGWCLSNEQIQFRNTALLDITADTDDLLAAMKSKTRYNIRLGMRKGVTVRAGATEDDIALFNAMYAETGQRDGFLIRPVAYYRDVWTTFMTAGMAHMLLAQVGNETVAGLILFHLGDKVWFMYGASTTKHRNLMPNYVLQWEAIRWAKSIGCTMYDLWGAPDTLDENDQLWGVWKFKQGLGAQFTPHIGAYDYPASRFLYWAYTVALPKYLALLRRRHRISASG